MERLTGYQLTQSQMPRTLRSPWLTERIRTSGTSATGPSISSLLRVTSDVTLTTESFDRPVAAAGRKTLPGIDASAVLDVRTTAMAVASRLSLYDAVWTTSTGRRFAGRLPTGRPRSAQ